MVVNLGKSLAMMPKSAQMPNERYVEGQKLRMVITEVNRETKGAQVLVSRADPKLVRRLFEREVPEIYEGVVEIKAIAREAGERTKIAVYSKNEDIDPIGACIGPRGSRVQVVIEELHGEKIDIFQWSENVPELIKNALSPAQILGVYPAEDAKGLIVVVDDSQLSLAIGKKGKNARLAVKLTGSKIDIKSKTELDEQGIDWVGLHEAYQQELAAAFEIETIEAVTEDEAEFVVDDMVDAVEITDDVDVYDDVDEVPEVETKLEVEAEAAAPEVEAEVEDNAEVDEEQEMLRRIRREIKPRTGYVSRFEKLADASYTDKKEEQPAPRRRTKEREEPKIDVVEMLKQKDYDIKIEYTEEELEEIRRQEEAERASSWIEDDIDFDQYDEFYEEE